MIHQLVYLQNKQIQFVPLAQATKQESKKQIRDQIKYKYRRESTTKKQGQKGTKIAITNSSRIVKKELTLTLNSEKVSTSVRGVTIFRDITIYFIQEKINAIDLGLFSRNRIYLCVYKQDAEKESAIGDTIGIVIVLMNKTLSSQTNGEDMGIAFKNIPKKISIYARVHLGQLKLL
ncbi:spry domain-containing socs box protein [Anaeramoeba flamelloides]|uniref:Spry domain-containing socs box protein n=1 Tax=Anaeramoeba flamelloides TaxID=1746091 RepID=A0AAV7ZKK4_9EUKA|nr:spry domain-containing socs box protein [Anaeramoeba flamelloides]